MLKLGCTQPNLTNVCQHKTIYNKFHPFIEADKELHDKIGEVMTGAPSVRKFIEMKTFPLLTINLHLYNLFI